MGVVIILYTRTCLLEVVAKSALSYSFCASQCIILRKYEIIMQIQQIALVTCESLGHYSVNADSEDDRLFQFLQTKGHQVSLQVWDDAHVDWKLYDAIILRTPWDYFDKIDAFYSWLDKLEQLNCRVFNPVKTLRWNADKIYFKDMQLHGVEIVPTIWLDKESKFDAEVIFRELQTNKIVVKPRVSGAAKNTMALTLTDALERSGEIQALLQSESFLAQPFLEQIKEQGEWSFIFFNGRYSHTVLKKAKADDFRVQHFFGGTVYTPEPPAHLLATAQEIATKFAADCLYARVDGIELDGKLVLMELELIEPFLFLSTAANSLDHYYEAMQELIN
jgi:glutathione synthase/RimK-type ligase-like ATP-grasp enzyme